MPNFNEYNKKSNLPHDKHATTKVQSFKQLLARLNANLILIRFRCFFYVFHGLLDLTPLQWTAVYDSCLVIVNHTSCKLHWNPSFNIHNLYLQAQVLHKQVNMCIAWPP